jgi:rod shape-determining protein MreD
MTTRLRLGLVILTAFLLQVTVFVEFHPLGVAPELPLLVAVLAGRTAGPERGAFAGFAAGLLYDLQLSTPFGLWALTCCLVAFAMGRLTEALHRPEGLVAVATTALASVGGVAFFTTAGALLGERDLLTTRTLRVALLVGVVNLALSPLAGRAVRWSYRPTGAVRAAA